MVNVGDQLKKTSKGQLSYSRELTDEDLKALLQQCRSPPTISSFHKEVTPVSGTSFGLYVKEDDTPVTYNPKLVPETGVEDYEESGQKEKCNENASEKSADYGISRLNESNAKEDSAPTRNEPDKTSDEARSELEEQLINVFNSSLTKIECLDSEWDSRAQDSFRKKELQFRKNEVELDLLCQNLQEKARECLVERQNQLEIELIVKEEKVPQTVQTLRKSHSDCTLRQDARLKKVEELNQQLREEKARRRQELEQKVLSMMKLVQEIKEATNSLVSSIEGCHCKDQLGDWLEKRKTWLKAVVEQVEKQANIAEKNGNVDEVLHKLEQHRDEIQKGADIINKAIAQNKAKEAEAQRQVVQSTPQADQVQTTTSEVEHSSGAPVVPFSSLEEQALAGVAEEFEKYKKLTAEVTSMLEPFVKNQQMKTIRFALQKAVNTPINGISAVSKSHLLDTLRRLQMLLRGQEVHVSDKTISARAAPQGILFCKNLVARMVARKAEEQVSSNHESAFAIAAVAVGLWTEFPDVGDLLMAHLQELCPYVLPYYQPHLPGQSSVDYYKSLGYKVDEDGTTEQQDKFLKRMSGVMRLYAAILVTSPPPGLTRGPNPHGLEHAWIWLGRALNLHPSPDITATAIYDVLQVTGHALLRVYRVQFVKLLFFILKSYLPKLKEVAATSGPVSRLEIFLETVIKNHGIIQPPEGYIVPDFWN